MFASAMQLQCLPLQRCISAAVQPQLAACSRSCSMALDRAQTAPFHISSCNPHAGSSSELGELEARWMPKTRRNLWRIVRATGLSADGLPASDSGFSLPKSDGEWSELLFPSEHPLGRSANSTSESVDRRLASPPPSEAYSETTGETGVAVSQTTIDSTSEGASERSTVLANTLPSIRNFDASFEPALQTERGETEARIARWIVDFRFLAMLAVAGSLAGSCICFLQGCVFIVESYAAFYTLCMKGVHTGKVVLYLVEAVDVFLAGTVMLIFGMGLYELFINNVPNNLPPSEDRALQNSSLFGMFLLKERPKWMRIGSLDELKSKLGHLIVMILLVKMFERSKAISIRTGVDLLSYSISIFLSSGALFVLNKLP